MKPKASSQLARFKKAAKDLGADESGEAFERAFKKIVPEKRPKATRGKENGNRK